MREFKNFANADEKKTFVEVLKELKQEFGPRFAKAGIEDVILVDNDAPYVLICYQDLRIEMLPGGKDQLRERIECDEGLVRSYLEEECKRDASSPMDMLKRGFNVLTWAIDDLGIGITPVITIDPDTQETIGMTLECDFGSKDFPLSYYAYAEIKHAAGWHRFLYESNMLK